LLDTERLERIDHLAQARFLAVVDRPIEAMSVKNPYLESNLLPKATSGREPPRRLEGFDLVACRPYLFRKNPGRDFVKGFVRTHTFGASRPYGLIGMQERAAEIEVIAHLASLPVDDKELRYDFENDSEGVYQVPQLFLRGNAVECHDWLPPESSRVKLSIDAAS